MRFKDIGQIAASAIEIGLATLTGETNISEKDRLNLLEALQDDLEQVLAEAVTKTVDGKPRPAGDFLVVEDSEEVSTWHLPVKVNGTPDHRLMGAAWAALHGGYRGQKYEGPDKEKAIAELRSLYKSEDMTPPGESEEVMAEADSDAIPMLQEALMSIEDALAVLQPEATEEPEAEPEPEEEVAEFCESFTGGAITLLEEAEAVANPLTMQVEIIQPGWGNKKDNHYYPAEMLKRDAQVFVGSKMYETDHKANETNNRTWVSTVTDILGFSDKGAPIAEVLVHSPDFAQRARNLKAGDILDKLECSIRASGRTKPYEKNGRKGRMVEAITNAKSVDWVTRAGAGGRAVNIMESDTNSETEGGDLVNKSEEKQEEVVEEEVQEEETKEEAKAVEEVKEEEVKEEEIKQEEINEADPEPEETLLSESEVTSLLAEAKLPDAAKVKLALDEYPNEDALKEAINGMAEMLQAITGSGDPVMPKTKAAEPMPLAEVDALRDQVNQQWLNTRIKVKED